MRTAKQHFYDALGGNMNIATLTPLAFESIMDDYTKYTLNALKKDLSEFKKNALLSSDVKAGIDISIEQVNRIKCMK